MAAIEPQGPRMVSLEEARRRLRQLGASRRLPAETVPLAEAHGRVLATDAIAPHDVPPFDNSAMDGYALRAADLPATGDAVLPIAGTMLAGTPTPLHCPPAACVRIMTGAPLPDGADTVVIRENVVVEGSSVRIRAGERARANVRAAGEDTRRGEIALTVGTRLAAAELGVLASLGQVDVSVVRRPRVAVLTTGDELVPPGCPLGFGQIHDSNGPALSALLREAGVVPIPVRHVRDDPALLREALHSASACADLVVSSGGVSAGEADHLPAVVAELGRVHFWKVRMKPGMPFLCGDVGPALMVGLPGNPVSTMATFLALVRPCLAAMQGLRDDAAPRFVARLAHGLHKKHGRAELLRVRIVSGHDGVLQATAVSRQGSGMMLGLAEADALAVLPDAPGEYGAGTPVEVLFLRADLTRT